MRSLRFGAGLFFLCFLSAAVAAEVQWNKRTFRIDYPSSWKVLQNFLGIPVTFFAPMLSGQKNRTVIQLIPTEAKALAQTQKELDAFNKNYPREKEKWLKDRHGSLLSLLPAALEEYKKDKKMVVAGLAYRIGDFAYTEKTFYINCDQKIVQLKIAAPLGDTADFNEAERIVRSFECDK